jgi:hypothetical protein
MNFALDRRKFLSAWADMNRDGASAAARLQIRHLRPWYKDDPAASVSFE